VLTARTLAALALALAPSLSLAAQAAPPPAGEYACMTTSFSNAPGAPMGSLVMFPAIFGRILLDGRGGYQLPARRTRGTYSFNASRSELRFDSGDLTALMVSQPGIDNGVYRFGLTFNSNSYECSAQGQARAATAGSAAARPAGPLNRGLTGSLLISRVSDIIGYPLPVYRFDLATGRASNVFPNGVGVQSAHGEIIHLSSSSRILLTDASGDAIIREISNDNRALEVDLFLAISPSGDQYAMTGEFRANPSTLFGNIAPPDGNTVKVFSRNGQQLAELRGYTHAAFRPNGGLVVAGDGMSKRGLFVIDADLRTVRAIVNSTGTVRYPAVSPDGRRVAYVKNGETWVVGIDGSNPQRVFDEAKTFFPTWSPDGRYVAGVLRAKLPSEIVESNLIGIARMDGTTERFLLLGADRMAITGGNRISWLPAGSATGTSAPGAASTPVTTSAATPAPTAARPESLTGHFEGTYVCSAGETAMELDIRAAPDGTLTATMSFGGSANARVGRYALAGRWTGNSFQLAPEKWVDQPPNYVMTPLSGTISGGVIAGRVEHPRCGAMRLQRR
jgi:WD40-like Beta Propeller Repeat